MYVCRDCWRDSLVKIQKTTFYCAAKQKIGSVVEDKRHTNKGQLHTLILEDDDIIDQTVQLFQKKKIKNTEDTKV